MVKGRDEWILASFARNSPLETSRNLEFLALLESEAVDAGEEGGERKRTERGRGFLQPQGELARWLGAYFCQEV